MTTFKQHLAVPFFFGIDGKARDRFPTLWIYNPPPNRNPLVYSRLSKQEISKSILPQEYKQDFALV